MRVTKSIKQAIGRKGQKPMPKPKKKDDSDKPKENK